MSNRQDQLVKRLVKGIKWGGGALVLGLNTFLLYNYLHSYQDGQLRGEILYKQKQAQLKKDGKKDKPKTLLPQQLQPEYIEKQVRKYKQVSSQQKKS